jgi:hypothetical protein
VHEIGRPGGTAYPKSETRIQVTGCRYPLERNGQRLVERIRRARRVVQPEKADVDTAFGQCRQEREQMPFGSADPADPVNVENLHRREARRASAQSTAAAAGRAMRKSVATR